MEGLRECPFCDGDVTWDHVDSDVWIDCCMCHAHFRVMFNGFPKKWNTRATDPLLEEMGTLLEKIWAGITPDYENGVATISGDILNDLIGVLQKYREATKQTY